MHEPWDENYQRGYEWWIMTEAKRVFIYFRLCSEEHCDNKWCSLFAILHLRPCKILRMVTWPNHAPFGDAWLRIG